MLPQSEPSVTPRGLSRSAAAGYVGVSTSKFDEMVASGSMPGPKRIGTRKVWGRRALDDAFESLPDEAPPNPWD